MLHINAYIWDLENWYQGRNRIADVESGLVNAVGGGGSGVNGESSLDIYTLSV